MLMCSARITQAHIPDIEHNCDGVHGLEERNMKTINVSEITDDAHMEAVGNDLLETCHEVRSICRFYIQERCNYVFSRRYISSAFEHPMLETIGEDTPHLPARTHKQTHTP